MTEHSGFHELADGVHLLAYPFLQVNCTLIVGDGEAMLVDTLSTNDQARELLAAVREITDFPLTVVNTHFHFDHCYGNAMLAQPGRSIWGHEECARELRERGAQRQRRLQQEYAQHDERLALALGQVTLLPPDQQVHQELTVGVGGRPVTMSHHGRGHTSGDLVVRVGEVIVAGDLVEEGSPPGFDDSYPLDWPGTLVSLIELAGPNTVVIPGHGQVVDVEFVRIQHEELSRLDWLIREAHGDGADQEKVARATSLIRWGESGLREARHAVRRGYAQLDVV